MPFGWFKRRAPREKRQADQAGRGFLVFENTSEVIRAEKILKADGRPIRVMGPPPEMRKGCDLVIEFPLIEELNLVRRLEKAGLPPLEVVPVAGPLLSPVDIYQIKDFGAYLMVRAANMKITVRKDDQTIVNISGGGCPDAPYLAREMVGRTLAAAPHPRDIGHTLCGYALALAYEKAKQLC
ncbi:MAG: DUF3343 domain-containing protein [Thermodesulfobacteriota bacterium]